MKKVIFALLAVFVLTAFIPKELLAKKVKVDTEFTIDGVKIQVLGWVDVEDGKIVHMDLLLLFPDGDVIHYEGRIYNPRYDERTRELTFGIKVKDQLLPISVQVE